MKEKMKNVNRKELLTKIQQESDRKDFNVYQFARNFSTPAK